MSAANIFLGNVNKKNNALRLMRHFERTPGRWPETKRAATLADKFDARAKKMLSSAKQGA
jgi:hypothetical protein